MNTKKCSKCLTVKCTSDFYPHRGNGGWQHICKVCDNANRRNSRNTYRGESPGKKAVRAIFMKDLSRIRTHETHVVLAGACGDIPDLLQIVSPDKILAVDTDIERVRRAATLGVRTEHADIVKTLKGLLDSGEILSSVNLDLCGTAVTAARITNQILDFLPPKVKLMVTFCVSVSRRINSQMYTCDKDVIDQFCYEVGAIDHKPHPYTSETDTSKGSRMCSVIF